MKFDTKASLLRSWVAILCTIILAPGDTLAYASQSGSTGAAKWSDRQTFA